MTGRPNNDPGRRAALAASLEYGTHALLGQHLYRQVAVPTIPRCMRCGKQRVLYGGICSGCLVAEEREEAARA